MVRNGELFWVWEGEVKKEVCNHFVEHYFKPDLSHKAAIGGTSEKHGAVNESVRKTNVCWIDDQLNPLYLLMYNYILRANVSAKWFFDVRGIEPIQLGSYQDGGFYDFHQDNPLGAEDENGATRKLSGVMFLSDEKAYEGGDLVMFLGKEVIVPKAQGTIVVFPSATYHKVTPVTKGDRFSAVCWAKGPAFL
jgi:PKHD-type hydroxylase